MHRHPCKHIRCQLDTWVSLANLLSMNHLASKSGSRGCKWERRQRRARRETSCTSIAQMTSSLLHTSHCCTSPISDVISKLQKTQTFWGGVETQPSAVLYLFRWKVKPVMPKNRSPTRMHKNTASRRYVRPKYVSFVVMHVDIAAMRNFDPSASDEGISKTPYLFQKKCDRPVLPKKMIFLSRFF